MLEALAVVEKLLWRVEENNIDKVIGGQSGATIGNEGWREAGGIARLAVGGSRFFADLRQVGELLR